MALTQSKTVDILEKKFLWGKSATEENREYFEEAYSSRPIVLGTDCWLQSDQIPSVAATVSGVLNLVTATLSWVDGTNGSYYNSSLVDVVPQDFGNGTSYRWRVYRNDGVTDINWGESEWYFDNSSGVLTFTSATSGDGLVYNGSGIIIASSSAPPVMSVWKYVGKKGFLPNLGTGLTYSGGTLSAMLDGGSENLQATLAFGNTMGTYSIIMNSGKLYSTSLTSSFAMSDSQTVISSPVFKLISPNQVFGGDNIWTMIELAGSGATNYKMFEIYNSVLYPNSVCSIDVTIQGFDSTTSLYYSNKMFAFFTIGAGIVSQIGTTSMDVRSNLSSGYADIDTDGVDIRVIVQGDSGSNINWVARINYNIST